MSETIRIGLLGLGRHGIRYARHLARGDVPNATLSAVWTRDPKKRNLVADELSAAAADSVHALVQAPVDAVIAAVPAGLHQSAALACAAAGKPLLLEKPLARSTAEGLEICEAFEAAGAPLMVAQTLRFDPLLRALRERRAELGELVGFAFEQRIEPRGLPWEDDPAVSGGGVLMQTAIHTLDAARFVTEAAGAQVLQASANRVHYERNEDQASVQLALEGGPALTRRIVGDVQVSKIGGSRHMRFTVFGTEAGFEADFIARTLSKVVQRDREVIDVPETPTVPRTCDAFVQFLLHKAPNPVPGREALASLALVEAAYAAARAEHARRG